MERTRATGRGFLRTPVGTFVEGAGGATPFPPTGRRLRRGDAATAELGSRRSGPAPVEERIR